MPVRDIRMGERIKHKRGMRTLDEIASAVGIYAGDLLRYERGRIPRGDILERLAVALGVSSRWLLTGSEKRVDIVADPFADYESKDPRMRLVREIKKFALEADPERDAKLISALLENVIVFREVLERRQKIKGDER